MNASTPTERLFPVRDIFQILILDGGGVPALLPAQVRRNVASLREHHPAAVFHLLGALEVRSFLTSHFDAAVIEAYDRLVPYAYKADLARACLLLHFGGMYSDIANFFVRPWSIPADKPLAAFKDLGPLASGAPFAVANGLIHAPAQHPQLRDYIDLVVAHVNTFHYGINPLCPTGPVAWGQVLASSPDLLTRSYLGETRALTPELPNHNPCFIDPQGRLVALRMKESSGDVHSLGLEGGNNYNQIWRERRVYGELRHTFLHTSPQLQYRNGRPRSDGVRLATRAHDCLVFGPYITLGKGRWWARFKFAPHTLKGTATADVIYGLHKQCLVTLGSNQVSWENPHTLAFAFELDDPVDELEVRLFGENFVGTFLELELQRDHPAKLQPA